MAETKRIQLETPKTLQRDKKLKEVPPTYRFDLRLTENADTGCVEFSYAELLKREKVAERELKNPAGDDPFSLDDDIDKLQEIARRFEEKYNPKPSRKKKKNLAVSEDFIDRGMGYDETDPFIDNDEAYDELVPSTLTTEHGGFYINKGDLEFKNVSESESGNDSKIRKKRRRQLTDKDGKKKRRIGSEEIQKKRGRKPVNESLSVLPKQKKKPQPTVADMLQQHKAQLQLQQHDNLQQLELNPIAIEREVEPEETEEISPVQGTSICEAIESVVKAAGEEISNGSVGPITGSSDEDVKPVIENIEAPKLPENLPPDLDVVLAKLKEAAYRSEEGKCKFFSEEVNRMLLSVELKAQELTSAQRSTIYSHLASHLPCTKETLQKRAKKLRLDQEDGKLREPMQRLRDGIASTMPDMFEKYAALLKACDARDDEKKNDIPANNSEGEDSQEDGEKKASRLPKKHFEWNDTIRKYLCDVVRIKLKCYEVSKTRIQSAEEYLKHFLEAEVKNLWPPGWMQSRILFRESRAAHFYITNRPKKQILVPKKIINPLSSVMLTMKPAVSLLNAAGLPQESEFEQMFQTEKCVPSINTPQPFEDIVDRKDNIELLMAIEKQQNERVAEFAKLFTLPIKNTTPDGFVSTKDRDSMMSYTINAKQNAETSPKAVSAHANSISDSMVLKNISPIKTEKYSRLNQLPVQNKPTVYSSSKVPDFNTFTEGSLASDMLSRIICASLADFPYAGSQTVENSISKAPNVISSSTATIKQEPRSTSSKFSNDILTSPKKFDSGKSFNTDLRKSSHEIGLHNYSACNINIGGLAGPHQNISRQSDATSVLAKNKGLPGDVSSSAVNLKLKDSIVPHSRQFAEAFERTADVPPLIKKHIAKSQNIHTQKLPISIASSSNRLNANELLNEYPSSTSPRSTLESAQKLAFDLAAKFNATIPTQGPIAPYKKRTKYTQSNKTSDQWNHFLDAGLGTSILEGMKGFPFPVSSLPAPPPAHASAPLRTMSHSQHSPRTSSHISPGLRNLHDIKVEPSSSNNSQVHSHISVAEAPRRQSLLQGPWKSIPSCQAPSVSISHFMASTSPPMSIPSITTSSSLLNTNSHVGRPPTPAHSMPIIEKVSAAYPQSHNQVPPRASPSLVTSLGHVPKTSTPNIYTSQLGQIPYTTHQSSLSVSPQHQQSIVRSNNVFDPTNPSNVSSTATGSVTSTLQDMKTHPRTN